MKVDYEDFIENMYDGVYFVDKDRKITYWNKAAARITGFTAEEVIGSHCSDNILIHVDGDGNNLCQGMCPLAASIKDGLSREAEVYLHHRDGYRVPVTIHVAPQRDKNGEIVGAIELFSDRSSRNVMRLRIEELERLAFLDNLTMLANRRYIELEVESRLAEVKRYGSTFGILLMDIDHFKRFNDTYGHDVGDIVLKTVAQSLLLNARPFDLFGRWGEEFMGIIRNVDISSLEKIGSRIRVLVEQTHVQAEGIILSVTISIGATIASPRDTIQSLIKRADALLYKSKEKGRNCLTTDQSAEMT